ncbi:hypothetical protein F5Y05DRAFT_196943 [Hypoxylon sp. FL0543]|nr:hypothetical protein F5Y05DRAFT_196943 [Hypoxylon sp. FL0543]
MMRKNRDACISGLVFQMPLMPLSVHTSRLWQMSMGMGMELGKDDDLAVTVKLGCSKHQTELEFRDVVLLTSRALFDAYSSGELRLPDLHEHPARLSRHNRSIRIKEGLESYSTRPAMGEEVPEHCSDVDHQMPCLYQMTADDLFTHLIKEFLVANVLLRWRKGSERPLQCKLFPRSVRPLGARGGGLAAAGHTSEAPGTLVLSEP